MHKLDTLKQHRKRQAGRAVERFNRMRPAIESQVRRQTGNPTLKVRVGANTSTDGKTIWIKPPMQMAYKAHHNRSLCGIKEYGVSVCPACSVNDEIRTLLDHEIGHIMHGSFDPYPSSEMHYTMTIRDWLRDTKYLQRFNEQYDDDLKKTPVKFRPLIERANSLKHPLVSFATLCMEDVRIDHARIKANPAEAEGYDALSADLLEFGIPTDDGYKHYIDMSLPEQAMMGFLFASRNFEIDGFFAEEVVEAMLTPLSSVLLDRALNAVGTVESFKVGLDTLEYFHSRGLLNLNEEHGDDLDEELMEMLMKILRGMLGHGNDPSQGGAPGKPGQGEADGEGEADGSIGGGWNTGGADTNGSPMGQGMRPEDIEAAAKSLELLGVVPEKVEGPSLFEDYDPTLPGWQSGRYYDSPIRVEDFKTPERLVSPALTSARLAFGVNARVERHRNQRSGRVHGASLARRVPFEDDRLFAKRTVPDKRDYHVLIGMDISGSTSGQTLKDEKMAVLAMCTVLSRLGITFEVWAHTTHDSDDAGNWNYGPGLYQVKAPGATWNADTQRNLRELSATGGNLDGHTLLFYRRRLEKSRATERILMYYTDGAMPASNYEEELAVMQESIKYCNDNSITLMAVGMGVDTPKEHGFDTVVVDVNNPDYRKVVDHLGKRLTK